ncbi:hypothetical protein BU23DRAFT_562933 [Bimuria novae-zelandiae CBS 107.79]|uniref:Uncharacterized protein n=1 Tax=Bimuria novae-zelandiae CBS 107.79 TaxID=1447943 RepID=A0A6A5W258_9PLEO|nr:hypothetical protein BU23DRAFT_562933 [Bimuria novae-zelandiae CBS 107.79]
MPRLGGEGNMGFLGTCVTLSTGSYARGPCVWHPISRSIDDIPPRPLGISSNLRIDLRSALVKLEQLDFNRLANRPQIWPTYSLSHCIRNLALPILLSVGYGPRQLLDVVTLVSDDQVYIL